MDGMKPQEEMIFKSVNGLWVRVDSHDPKPGTLAETLQELNIIIDDKCQFARLYDYDNNICIYYRAHAKKITITIWKINIL